MSSAASGSAPGLDGGSADGISQHLVAVLGSEGLGLVRTLVGGLNLLVQVGAQALGAAADDLVQLALGDQLGLFVLAGLGQQPLDRLDIQAVELAFQLVQFGLMVLFDCDQLGVFGLRPETSPSRNFCTSPPSTAFSAAAWVSSRVRPWAAGRSRKACGYPLGIGWARLAGIKKPAVAGCSRFEAISDW